LNILLVTLNARAINNSRGMLPAFLTTVLFSISAVCGSRSARILGGTAANFWRLSFAAVLLAVYAHTFGGGIRGAGFKVLFISGCIGFGLGDAALFQTFPRLGSRLSILFTSCLSAPIAAFIEWLWLGAHLTTMQIMCGGVVLAGVAIALSPSHHLAIKREDWLPGVIFGLLAAFCQAYGAVLSRKAYAIARSAGEDIDGISAAYQRILGGVVVITFLMILVNWQRWRVRPVSAGSNSEKAWPWVLMNGLAGPALGVSCYQWALKSHPTGVVLPIVAITPLVIIPFSRYIEGERPTVRSLLGGIIAVIGAIALARWG
jgi:drug/metabolite transporter (DMT)-like permease